MDNGLYLVEATCDFIFSKYGTSEAKEKFLPKVTSGDEIYGIAITETKGGSDIIGAGKTKQKRKKMNTLNQRIKPIFIILS